MILNSTFRDNIISGFGSAIYMGHINLLSIVNSNFVRNTTYCFYGRGIYMYQTNSLSVILLETQQPEVEPYSCIVQTYCRLPTVLLTITQHPVVVEPYTWVCITCSSSMSDSTLMIDGCIFANNAGYQGGVLYIDISYQYSNPFRCSNCTVNRSIFINNTAVISGGVRY